ncbi:MAG: NINE protein [Alistipes sp.]|nr:NINE protein [Alistipes sp.]MBO7194515.1 NINE protein [Alistipes sp.]
MALIYCRECGKQISDQAFTCPFCGCPMGNGNPNQQVSVFDPNRSKYDWLTTLLLCFFLGCFGIHNFYTGKTGIGVAQLLTCGGCGIWALIDFIMIIVGSFRDGEGKVVSNK